MNPSQSAAGGWSDGTIRTLASWFYHDRRLLVLVILLITVAGLSSVAVLPRMEDPVLRKRAALINTRLPGADAERVESLITSKIEDRLRDIEEIKELRSVSRVGISTVSIELLDSVNDTDPVWSRVRGRIEDALPDLPHTASRPEFEELQVRAYALIIGLVWDRQEPADVRVLRRIAIDFQNALQNLPGTDLVDRFGDPGEQIQINLQRTHAAAMGLTAAEVASRLVDFDAKRSAGQYRRDDVQLLIEVGNQFDLIEQIGQTPIRETGDRFVRLADVADIELGLPDPPVRAANLDGREAIVLGAMVRPSYRIDTWTANADRMIADFAQTLPAGVRVETVLRQSDYVDQRLTSLISNLLMGAIGVSGVILILMGWRSALIVTLTLPLASLMVLFCLRLCGIPIHQMSITGLIISLGLLIDNAIVVVDEVKNRLKTGVDRVAAMADAVKYLAVPLLGSTLTTGLAFAPIALMPGPAGEFVSAIAISVMFAIASSLFLALTIIPSIASRYLSVDAMIRERREGPAVLAWLRRTSRQGLQTPRIAAAFSRLLSHLLVRPWTGVGLALIPSLVGFALFPTLREQFFPPSGRNQFHVTIDGPATNSLSQTRRTAAEVDAVLRRFDAARVDWFFGESAPQFYYNVLANRRGTANFAQGLVTMPTASQAAAVIGDLQDRLDREVTSSRVLVRQLEQGPPFEAPVEVQLFGPDLQVLRNLGNDYRRLLSSIPEVTYCRSDLDEVLPQVSLNIDGEAARTAGLSPTDVADQLFTSLEGSSGGSVLQDNEELPIVVRVDSIERGDLARIKSMDLVHRGDDGNVRRVPLAAIAEVTLTPESAAIPRLNRRRMNEVNAYVHAGVLPSVVQQRIEDLIAASDIELPQGYEMRYGGEASKRNDAVGNLMSTVGVLSVLMLATLVLSFGSFRMAGIIAVVAAMSIGLGLLSLEIAGYPFGFMSIIGTMGLVGVAINDSIVVLAAILAHDAARSGDVDAMVGEIMHTSRHVVATTLTTMVGFAPLILDGGQFWPPMAICIAGGVAGATIIALVMVPSIYRILTRSARGGPNEVAKPAHPVRRAITMGEPETLVGAAN